MPYEILLPGRGYGKTFIQEQFKNIHELEQQLATEKKRSAAYKGLYDRLNNKNAVIVSSAIKIDIIPPFCRP